MHNLSFGTFEMTFGLTNGEKLHKINMRSVIVAIQKT